MADIIKEDIMDGCKYCNNEKFKMEICPSCGRIMPNKYSKTKVAATVASIKTTANKTKAKGGSK